MRIVDFHVSAASGSLHTLGDGEKWEKIGTTDYRMRFDWRRFFMGSKYAIFCYATKKAGGYIDVDSFNYKKIAE